MSSAPCAELGLITESPEVHIRSKSCSNAEQKAAERRAPRQEVGHPPCLPSGRAPDDPSRKSGSLRDLAAPSVHAVHDLHGRTSPGAVGLVVDHQLRADSAAEAWHALSMLEKIGLPSRLLHLTWPHGKPSKGRTLEAARSNRYAALTTSCKELGCSMLLTGHQAGLPV